MAFIRKTVSFDRLRGPTRAVGSVVLIERRISLPRRLEGSHSRVKLRGRVDFRTFLRGSLHSPSNPCWFFPAGEAPGVCWADKSWAAQECSGFGRPSVPADSQFTETQPESGAT